MRASELELRQALSPSINVEVQDKRDRYAAQQLFEKLHSPLGERLTQEFISASRERASVREFLSRYGDVLGTSRLFRPPRTNAGQSRIMLLDQYFQDLVALLGAESEDIFLRIKKGGVVAYELRRFLDSQRGRRIVEGLRQAGVSMTEEPAVVAHSPFSGRTIVITGTFDNFDRSTLTAKLQASGAKVVSSVSRNTDLVLVGRNPGSKLDNAREFGVETWSEEELLKHLSPMGSS